ncbi:hypothetical protein [Cohnella hongkongensis]|uniref:Uncharacterized protein n=1 Tax=Cohnella hongkongensis TaxID=178337 RepID=A0ABV9FC53_9BACL
MKRAKKLCAMLGGAGWLLLAAAGCVGPDARMPADKAFALSASALSGTDSYGFAGELALYNPKGRMETKAAFEGEVNRHGSMKLNWTTSDKPEGEAEGTEGSAPSYRPLSLLKALGSRSAAIEYADPPSPGVPVRIRIRLDEETAKRRIADALREEMDEVRADRTLYGTDPERARRKLEEANRKLEAALATLKVDTVVLWTANSKSWFPIRMEEETELSYAWEGKAYSEKRMSETNFLVKA